MNKWEKYVKKHNENYLQIPFQFFRFTKNDFAVILLAEILDELIRTNTKSYVFLSKKALTEKHELENAENKIIFSLLTLKHRKILNNFTVLKKFGETGDKIRIDVNEQRLKNLLLTNTKFGRKIEL
jgi:hypothetical protein